MKKYIYINLGFDANIKYREKRKSQYLRSRV